jgi:G6PDH family F420-dependent oxidoreductase
MRIGFALACEEYSPQQLLEQARRAEQAGFCGLWISDHYHPWNEEQGQSPFVWTMIGAIAQATSRIPVITAVTCPTIRIHPAIIAQAAATSAMLLEGRFALGVGTGEALNEHILGDRWPRADVRLEMLEEAVAVIRVLWEGGTHSHRGKYYLLENARIYTLPAEPPAILVSGLGPKSAALAGRIGDGYILTSPDPRLVETFRSSGGGTKVVQGSFKVCYGSDAGEARRTAWRLWPNSHLPGEVAQLLPTPAHFEQVTQLVTEEMIARVIPCGPDLNRHLELIEQFDLAGFEEVYVQQIGSEHEAFFQAYEREVLPRFN